VTQLNALLNFAIYLGVTIPLMILGYIVFMITTPYKEHQLIREGSHADDPARRGAAQAAAYDLGGKVLGLAIVIASAIFHSVDIMDLAIWGVVGIVFQVLVFYLFNWLAPFSVISEIPKGNVSVAVFSSRISVATGFLLASLISY
jgi:putative membrane protein